MIMINFQLLLMGLLTIFSTLSFRYIQMEITDIQDKYMSKPLIRFILIFSIVYISIRDFQMTIIVMALFFVIFHVLPQFESDYHQSSVIKNENKSVS